MLSGQHLRLPETSFLPFSDFLNKGVPHHYLNIQSGPVLSQKAFLPLFPLALPLLSLSDPLDYDTWGNQMRGGMNQIDSDQSRKDWRGL